MAWPVNPRPAQSLVVLKNQLDAAYPGYLNLGMLGDASHQAVASDHNANSAGVVTAFDIGPGGGLQIHQLADRLAAQPHPDCKYIISNRRIAEWQNNFQWRPYSGSDPHDTHIHISVGRGPDGQSTQPYDDRVQWNVTGEGDEMSAQDVQKIYETIQKSDALRDKQINQVYNDFVPQIEKLQKNLDSLYNIVDGVQKNVDKLLKK